MGNNDVTGIYAAGRFDHPLKPCDFAKWARFDSVPIEQACFVLLGFEPAPLTVIRARQILYQERRLPTWEKPQGFDDILATVESSISNDNLQAASIIVNMFLTKQVQWPALISWAKSKKFEIPPELHGVVDTAPAQNTATPATAETASEARQAEPQAVPAPVGANSASTAPAWTVHKPKRYRGYAAPLYRLLVSAHRDGKSRPTARDLLETWRSNLPVEVAKVLPDSFDYYDANGDTKTADVEAIRKAIARMTSAS